MFHELSYVRQFWIRLCLTLVVTGTKPVKVLACHPAKFSRWYHLRLRTRRLPVRLRLAAILRTPVEGASHGTNETAGGTAVESGLGFGLSNGDCPAAPTTTWTWCPTRPLGDIDSAVLGLVSSDSTPIVETGKCLSRRMGYPSVTIRWRGLRQVA